jgi:hypothetical protein
MTLNHHDTPEGNAMLESPQSGPYTAWRPALPGSAP